MAGNKMNTKTKSKDDKNKANSKVIGQNSEDCEEPDFALLRKPIHTSITGFGQARKIFDLATEELQGLLSNECDLLYECKVCRNIFRSLANFLSHKRVYCKEKFNTSLHSHFVKSTSLMSEMMKIKHLEESYQESLKENHEIKDEKDDRIPLTKDLTTIIEKIVKNKGVCESSSDEPQISLQQIPNSSVAMFQNMERNEEKQKDNMRAEVNELENILSKDIAILQRDGSFKIQNSVGSESDSVIQISDDDETDGQSILKCKICDMQFSTKKTLKFHMKYKHVESRLVYSCPDCLEIFATSWSVYRHLFKVHRKTAAQIRRLRESIQSKAFKMNNPPASYEKRKNNMKSVAAQKISEEERRDQENQAWMDNMEGDGELPRCGGCGRTFERRAALAAHTHTCQPRSRALARRPDTKKIEIQIRKDYNKGPPTNLNIPLKTTESNENKPLKDEPPIVSKENREEEVSPIEKEKQSEEDTPMEVSDDEQKPDVASESPEKETASVAPAKKLLIRLPFAFQAEKGNFVAFRRRVQSEIEVSTLSCKKCDSQFKDIQNLYDHVAEHIKWVRYACKLCNYKHFTFEKLPEHVKVVHKLKGDKDFYFSTVKAVEGAEALELCEPVEEREVNETDLDSRRLSRCSSDSSRLSDDSSSSSARVEGVIRKRKLCHTKHNAKRRKEVSKGGEDSKDSDFSEKMTNSTDTTPSNIKSCEENSSDLEDIEDRITKRHTLVEETSVASRRPVRRKAKPKNEDFEYDLSNLLKMEAQGYRDSLSMNNAKSGQTKKKAQQEMLAIYENLNKECCGALVTMAKQSVEITAAHLKTNFTNVYAQKEIRPQNVFLRPMLPKINSRGEKGSPKKDINEDRKECSSPSKDIPSKENRVQGVPKLTELLDESSVDVDEVKSTSTEASERNESPKNKNDTTREIINLAKDENSTHAEKTDLSKNNSTSNEQKELPKSANSTSTDKNDSTKNVSNPSKISIPNTSIPNKPKLNIPAVVPIKFRRQSIEVMKSPLINKNINDFTKAGMKTKILVIKPINRDKNGKQTLNSSLKFQTIKLKDTNKSVSKHGKLSKDQVVVVKVPQVLPKSEMSSTNKEKVLGAETTTSIFKPSNVDSTKSSDKDISKSLERSDTNSPDAISGDNVKNTSTAAEDEDTSCEDEVEEVGNILNEDLIKDEHEPESNESNVTESLNETSQ